MIRTSPDDVVELRRSDLAIDIAAAIAQHLETAKPANSITMIDTLAALEMVRHEVTEIWLAKNPGQTIGA